MDHYHQIPQDRALSTPPRLLRTKILGCRNRCLPLDHSTVKDMEGSRWHCGPDGATFAREAMSLATDGGKGAVVAESIPGKEQSVARRSPLHNTRGTPEALAILPENHDDGADRPNFGS